MITWSRPRYLKAAGRGNQISIKFRIWIKCWRVASAVSGVLRPPSTKHTLSAPSCFYEAPYQSPLDAGVCYSRLLLTCAPLMTSSVWRCAGAMSRARTGPTRRSKRKHMNAASRAVAARFHVSEHTYLRSEKTLSAKAKTCGGSFGSNADRPVCVHTHRARTQCSAKRRAGVMIVTFMLMLLPDQRVHERVQRCDGEGARGAEHTKDTRTSLVVAYIPR